MELVRDWAKCPSQPLNCLSGKGVTYIEAHTLTTVAEVVNSKWQKASAQLFNSVLSTVSIRYFLQKAF